MFRTAELGQTVSGKEFKKRSLELRQRLLEAQVLLDRTREFNVMIDFAGVDGAGKGQSVNLLHAWMDTRLMTTNAYERSKVGDRTRPRFWRYWRDLPRRGRIALNLSGRYSHPFLDRVNKRISEKDYVTELKRIQAFERALADDGMLVLKFWMHLSQDAQQQRLEALEANPDTAWRVTKKDWDHWKIYDRFIETAERTIADTNTEYAPWHIIEGVDANYRSIAVAEVLLDALNSRFAASNHAPSPELLIDTEALEAEDPIPAAPKGHLTVLETLEPLPKISKSDYRRTVTRLQGRISVLQRKALKKNRSSVLVFEGPDAAGKGGAIRRLIAALDARNYRVLQYGAPTDEEAARHYLWRFWRRLQPLGRLTVFDRSWYGRVLVERVEGFAREHEWHRAYAEINDFESQLIQDGSILVKFWLHVTPEEQRERLELRRITPHKQWKLTSEDWRNRARWYDYEQAAHDMVKYTSTHDAPWELIAADDKNAARIKVLETFGDYLEAALAKD